MEGNSQLLTAINFYHLHLNKDTKSREYLREVSQKNGCVKILQWTYNDFPIDMPFTLLVLIWVGNN